MGLWGGSQGTHGHGGVYKRICFDFLRAALKYNIAFV